VTPPVEGSEGTLSAAQGESESIDGERLQGEESRIQKTTYTHRYTIGGLDLKAIQFRKVCLHFTLSLAYSTTSQGKVTL